MNKIIMAVVITTIVAGGAGFYGGMQYVKSANPQNNSGNNYQNFQERRNGQQGFNAAGGQIIKIDDKSITVQLRSGGSKIIFFSDATKIMKSTDGSLKDLVVGEEITASGTANQDGSLTAQSIQIRPAVQNNQ